jgi:hypothetical protein
MKRMLRPFAVAREISIFCGLMDKRISLRQTAGLVVLW